MHLPPPTSSAIPPTLGKSKSRPSTPSQRTHDSTKGTEVDVSTIPPRVLNSFFLWKKHHRRVLAASRIPGPTSSKEWSLAWKALPQSERDYWQERFRENNDAFKKANPDYSYGAVKGLKKKAKAAGLKLRHHSQGSDKKEIFQTGKSVVLYVRRPSPYSHPIREDTPKPRPLAPIPESGTLELPTSECKLPSRLGNTRASRYTRPTPPLTNPFACELEPKLVRNNSLELFSGGIINSSADKMFCGKMKMTPVNSWMDAYTDGKNRKLSCPSIGKPLPSPLTALFREYLGPDLFPDPEQATDAI